MERRVDGDGDGDGEMGRQGDGFALNQWSAKLKGNRHKPRETERKDATRGKKKSVTRRSKV